ncbi:DMT family protein [Albidovulum sediminicola]|uniref:DMT family protein n=1 Tax=Albidovulum sediminicola TaxID=2984331 RepID=A0ABT2Z5V4_9RHOB|nr:DMT family protein [Defluviimonas sp. WL0075]MCV2866496.1 DMT family protein [Defluviimonas sp. WL0075]
MTLLPVPLMTVGLLVASNVFMTFAWYGHLKFKAAPILTVILASWGIALFEYMLQVPANRLGHGTFSAAQLKTIQEVISLTVFVVFSWAYLGERITWQHGAGFALIAAGAWVLFQNWG